MQLCVVPVSCYVGRALGSVSSWGRDTGVKLAGAGYWLADHWVSVLTGCLRLAESYPWEFLSCSDQV